MRSLIETIVARKQSFGGITLSAAEVEHLVLATVRAALDMACNAMDNQQPREMNMEIIRETIEPERILAKIKEDFAANVQDCWPFHSRDIPGLISHGDAETFGKGPVSELGLTATQIERKRIIGYAKTEPIIEADAPLYGHDKDRE